MIEVIGCGVCVARGATVGGGAATAAETVTVGDTLSFVRVSRV
jgi:hypothetical protein